MSEDMRRREENRLTASAAQRAAAAATRAAGADQAGYQRRGAEVASTRLALPSGGARSLAFPSRLRAKTEKRNGQDRYHVYGEASVFDTPYEMWDMFGPYEEIIESGSADETLAADPDVAFLVNHRGVTMARTTNDTLELTADEALDVDAWLNPKRQDVSDLVLAIEDREITEMSFAFILEEGWWSDDFTTFKITKFDINRGDVSAVNYGANPYTSIAARQQELLTDLERMDRSIARVALQRLLDRRDLDIDAALSGRAEHTGAAAAGTADTPPTAGDGGGEPTGRKISHIEALLDV